MAYNVTYTCDKCGITYGWTDQTISLSTAISCAREKGWQVGKRGWFCPECQMPEERKEGKDVTKQEAYKSFRCRHCVYLDDESGVYLCGDPENEDCPKDKSDQEEREEKYHERN